MPRMPNAGFCCLNAMSMFTHMKTGMDPAQSVKGGGGGCALATLVPSCVGQVCRPPINILYLNCNSCSQFAYHHAIAHITVSHFVSIIFCFICPGIAPPPQVNQFLLWPNPRPLLSYLPQCIWTWY